MWRIFCLDVATHRRAQLPPPLPDLLPPELPPTPVAQPRMSLPPFEPALAKIETNPESLKPLIDGGTEGMPSTHLASPLCFDTAPQVSRVKRVSSSPHSPPAMSVLSTC